MCSNVDDFEEEERLKTQKKSRRKTACFQSLGKTVFAPKTLTSIPRSRTIYSGSPFSFLPEPGVFLFELADTQVSFFELQP